MRLHTNIKGAYLKLPRIGPPVPRRDTHVVSQKAKAIDFTLTAGIDQSIADNKDEML
jgi:hypothetical protein